MADAISPSKWLIWGAATQLPLAIVFVLAVIFHGTWVYIAVFVGGPLLLLGLFIALVMCATLKKWRSVAFVLLAPFGLLSGAASLWLATYGSDWIYFQSHVSSFKARVANLQRREEPRFLVLANASFHRSGGVIHRAVIYYETGQTMAPGEAEVNAFLERKFFFVPGMPGNCVWDQEVHPMGDNYYIVRGACGLPASNEAE